MERQTNTNDNTNTHKIMINLDFLEPHTPSLCIPRVFNNIGETRIREVFDQLELGVIQRVDIIQRKNEKGEEYKRVFIHFARWSKSPAAQKARRKVLTGDSIKIVYDNPWFWKVEANKSVKFERDVKPKEHKKMRPVLVLDELDENENDCEHVRQHEHEHKRQQTPRYIDDHRQTQTQRQRPRQQRKPKHFQKYREPRDNRELREPRETRRENYNYRTPTPRPKHENYDDLDREDETEPRKLDFVNITLRSPKKKVLGKKILEVDLQELNEVSTQLYADLEVEEVEEVDEEVEEEPRQHQEDEKEEPQEVSDDEDFNRT